MNLFRDIRLQNWTDENARAAVEYLRSRGFRDARVLPGPSVSGRRGSWLGNFTSFDMTKLRATVHLAPSSKGATIQLNVNTFGQQITKWNVAVWRLEFVELQRVLRGASRIDDIWRRFDQAVRSAAIRWTLTLMTGGQNLTDSWEREIAELERAEELWLDSHLASKAAQLTP